MLAILHHLDHPRSAGRKQRRNLIAFTVATLSTTVDNEHALLLGTYHPLPSHSFPWQLHSRPQKWEGQNTNPSSPFSDWLSLLQGSGPAFSFLFGLPGPLLFIDPNSSSPILFHKFQPAPHLHPLVLAHPRQICVSAPLPIFLLSIVTLSYPNGSWPHLGWLWPIPPTHHLPWGCGGKLSCHTFLRTTQLSAPSSGHWCSPTPWKMLSVPLLGTTSDTYLYTMPLPLCIRNRKYKQNQQPSLFPNIVSLPICFKYSSSINIRVLFSTIFYCLNIQQKWNSLCCCYFDLVIVSWYVF